MVYGDKETVKRMKGITSTDKDSEITDDILTIFTHIFDLYDVQAGGSSPIDTGKYPIITDCANICAHGEYEVRHGDRDKGIARTNFGLAIFDNYLQAVYGVTRNEIRSAKVIPVGGTRTEIGK